MTRTRTAPRPALPTSPFKRVEAVAPTVRGLEVGDRITVDRYGMGRIVRVCLDQEIVCVDFGQGVVRHISPSMRGFCRL